MHVERERGGVAPTPELRRDEAVGGEIGPEAAVAAWNGQAEEARLAEIVEVREREGRLLVVPGRARREPVAAEPAGGLDEFALPFGERRIVHGDSLLRSAASRRSRPGQHR